MLKVLNINENNFDKINGYKNIFALPNIKYSYKKDFSNPNVKEIYNINENKYMNRQIHRISSYYILFDDTKCLLVLSEADFNNIKEYLNYKLVDDNDKNLEL